MITSRQYRQRTGRKPMQDDLVRSNCPLAGQPLHKYCGLNRWGMPYHLVPVVRPRKRLRCLQARRYIPVRSKA